MPIEMLYPRWLALLLAGLFGMVLGSFLNVCIVRWGAETKQSVVSPPSSCPNCKHQIRWFENIPVVSWLFLRGRCSGCGLPISVLYPAVELSTALLWIGAIQVFGISITALAVAVASTILLGIAVTDARAYTIPVEFSVGGAALALAFAYWSDTGVSGALLGAAFGAGFVLLVGEISEILIGQEAMGGGDCALVGMVGAFFGWQAVPATIMLGALVSILLYVAAALLPRRNPVDVPSPAATHQSGGVGWGRLLKLLMAGGALIAAVIVALRLGAFSTFMHAIFLAVVGAGTVFYVYQAVPHRVLARIPVRHVGMVGAGIGISTIGRPMAVLVGLIITIAALLWSRQSTVEEAPQSAAELSAEGYIPFGVGLAIAAGVLAYGGGFAWMRQAILDIAVSLA